MKYAYTRKVRLGYLVPAIASLLMVGFFMVFIGLGCFVPGSYAYRGLRNSGPWVLPVFGALVAWAVAACVPPMFRHYRTFVMNGSFRVTGLLGTRDYSWASIREIQIAKVPTSRNMRTVEQWMIRLFPGKHPVLIYDEIPDFRQLVGELDRLAGQHRIPLYTTRGVRRWEKTPVPSLAGQLSS